MKMSNKEQIGSQTNLIYGVDDNPTVGKKVLFGLQHIFAAFSGIVVVPLVISGALGFDSAMTTSLISASILAAGLATIIQAYGVGPVGARVACIMGTDFTFVSPAISVGSTLGMAGIVGATILGSLFEIILSFFIKPLMKLFPPIVTGTVVCLIAMLVLVVTLLLNRYGKGMISSASILIGMIVGYVVCIPFGMVDFTAVTEASWFAIPNILEYGIIFDWKAVLAFIPAYFVTTIETVGCLKAIGETSNVEMTDKKIGAGILADGFGSICGGLVGSFSNTSFSQNVGLISLTKVASKHVAVMAGILLVCLGLFPKLAGVINGIPQPVLGGVGLVMFGMVAAAGIKTLSRVELTDRNLLIIATSMALGLGVTFRPEFISGLPEALQMIFSSGISTGTIVALVLNLVLKETQVSAEKLKKVEVA